MQKSERYRHQVSALAAVFPKDLEKLQQLRRRFAGFEEICNDFELLSEELAHLQADAEPDTDILRAQIHESLDALREEIVAFLHSCASNQSVESNS